MKKPNYRVSFDRTFTIIEPTDEEADNEQVFASPSKAKKAALVYLRDEWEGFKDCIVRIKAYKGE